MEKDKYNKNKGDRRAPGIHTPVLVQQFAQFAHGTSLWTGHPYAFLIAVGVVLVWAVLGPIFNYSDTWQLVINTGTTIVTFLMVFLIQNTQNRDTLAIQIKLSELVLAVKGAENKFAAIEDLTDEELESLHDDCRARVEMTTQHMQSRGKLHPGNNRKSATASRGKSPSRHVA
jgi:low affinity Fe/Cu permease